jgi:hypothetical protein
MKKNTIKIRNSQNNYGINLLEFSKGTFFYNVLDGFFFCTAFTKREMENGCMRNSFFQSGLRDFNLKGVKFAMSCVIVRNNVR